MLGHGGITMQFTKLRKFFLGFTLVILASTVNAISPTDAVEQLVQGTKIKDVSLSPMPHSTAMRISIDTSEGQKNIILPKSQIHIALAALKNPRTTGLNNAMISARIISQKPGLMQYSSPPAPKPMSINRLPTKQLPTPSAAAIATMSVVSANQQASK